MRSVVGALIVMAALAGSSTAEDIYRWKDPAGRLHFENVPTPNPTTTPRRADLAAALTATAPNGR